MFSPEPVTIVGVVGGFHTGKSFLCNVLNGTTSGFEIGPTHEATTHGLWLGELKGHRASDGSRILLLDTEGFSARGVAESYDAQVRQRLRISRARFRSWGEILPRLFFCGG